MEAADPEQPHQVSEHATRGSRLHRAMESLIRTALADVPETRALAVQLTSLAVSEADREDLLWCWGVAAELLADKLPVTQPEHRLDLTPVSPHLTGGTADLIQAEPFGRGRVVDWKFGHRPVDAVGNLQLGAYASGLAAEYQLESVELVVVQPAHSAVRRTTLDQQQLSYLQEELDSVTALSKADWAPLRPGPWCRYCTALTGCPAVGRAVANIEDVDLSRVGARSLSKLLDLAEVVKAWAGSIQQQAFFRLEAGEHIPGYRLKETKRRKWKEGVTPEVLAEAFGVEASDLAIGDPISPAQVEKKLGKSKAVREIVERHVQTKESRSLGRTKEN